MLPLPPSSLQPIDSEVGVACVTWRSRALTCTAKYLQGLNWQCVVVVVVVVDVVV